MDLGLKSPLHELPDGKASQTPESDHACNWAAIPAISDVKNRSNHSQGGKTDLDQTAQHQADASNVSQVSGTCPEHENVQGSYCDDGRSNSATDAEQSDIDAIVSQKENQSGMTVENGNRYVLQTERDREHNLDLSSSVARALYSSEQLLVAARQSKSCHRDILFGLFLQEPASDLDDIAKSAQVSLLDTKNGRRNIIAGQHAPPPGAQHQSLPPSNLSLIPLTLLKSRKPLTTDYASPIDSKHYGINLKRHDWQSCSLEELESNVYSKFELSLIGKRAIACNSLQYSWFFEQKGMTNPTLTTPLLTNRRKQFLAKAMVFNEASMAFFAKWAFSPGGARRKRLMSKNSSIAEPKKRKREFTDMPSFAPMFHRCQVCSYWGHFELECTDLSQPNMLSVVACELTANTDLRNLDKQRPEKNLQHESINPILTSRPPRTIPRDCANCNSCSPAPLLVCNNCAASFHHGCVMPPSAGCQLAFEWLCPTCENEDKRYASDSAVEIEGCEGFVIEQRFSLNLSNTVSMTSNFPVGVNETAWSKVVTIMDDTLIATKTPISDCNSAGSSALSIDDKQEFTVGDFCWIKRENASIGMMGRDDWWPAQVIALAAATDILVPYLVKMLLVPYGNRIRPTAIIPFFKNFRHIVYTRMFSQTDSDSSEQQKFRLGVQKVVLVMGFKSIDDALRRSDELVRIHQDFNSRLLRERVRRGTDSSYIVFKQDDFVIRAQQEECMNIDRKLSSPEKFDAIRVNEHHAIKFRETKFAGCVVAWKSAIPDDPEKLKLGTILATDVQRKSALVCAIPQLETKLRATSSKTDIVVSKYHATVCDWMPLKKLHMISNGPQGIVEREIWELVVKKALEKADNKASTEVDRQQSA